MHDGAVTAVEACRIGAVGRRRDGGMRYWCLAHRADATAKYGKRARVCRYAHVAPVSPAEYLSLNVDDYPGGIALWGAVPPVYDTTAQGVDRGIHVHARRAADGKKDIDETYRAVSLSGGPLPPGGLAVSELDAIYYMVTSIFGYAMRHIPCSHCGYSHLDRDWFSVHAHRRHLCAGCGKNFRDTEPGIGNPACRVRDVFGGVAQETVAASRKLTIRQEEYPGGIRIWGSNPAIVWTGNGTEAVGIHVHVFGPDGGALLEDDTFAEVTVDGTALDPAMVRTLMAQSALPHVAQRVVTLSCPRCGAPKFCAGADAFTPALTHRCNRCGAAFAGKGRFRKTIGNPLVGILEHLASRAPRPPQKHDMGLLPEVP
jgi:hypothetical protein